MPQYIVRVELHVEENKPKPDYNALHQAMADTAFSQYTSVPTSVGITTHRLPDGLYYYHGIHQGNSIASLGKDALKIADQVNPLPTAKRTKFM